MNRSVSLARLVALSLGAATVVVSLSACAPLMIGSAVGGAMVASDRRTSGAQLEDQGIELRASNRLRDQLGERGNVSVTSYNRQVLLTGEVPDEATRQAVEAATAPLLTEIRDLKRAAALGSLTSIVRGTHAA